LSKRRNRSPVIAEFGKALGIDYCITSNGGLVSGADITMPVTRWAKICDNYDRMIWFERQVDFT
jgi:hypothetical protein